MGDMLSFIVLAMFAAVTFTVAPFVVTAISGIVLPLLVDLVTKSSAARWVKEITLGVLAVLAGLLADAVTPDGFAVISLDVALQALLAYAVAFVAFRRVAVVRSAADGVQYATPEFGIG